MLGLDGVLGSRLRPTSPRWPVGGGPSVLVPDPSRRRRSRRNGPGPRLPRRRSELPRGPDVPSSPLREPRPSRADDASRERPSREPRVEEDPLPPRPSLRRSQHLGRPPDGASVVPCVQPGEAAQATPGWTDLLGRWLRRGPVRQGPVPEALLPTAARRPVSDPALSRPPYVPEGRFRCSLCFDVFPVDEAWVGWFGGEYGTWNTCRPCGDADSAAAARDGADGRSPAGGAAAQQRASEQGLRPSYGEGP